MKITSIDKELLEPITKSRSKVFELTHAAEQAIKDARMAELEYKVQLQQLYLEKRLHPNCNVDISTGQVTWPEEEVVSEEVKSEDK